MENVKISVIIAAYNAENTLERTILSVLSQKIHEMEILLIDDGSVDNTADICKVYASNYSNVIFLQNEKNIGLGASENKGVHAARGEYIGFVDADDYIAEDFYQRLYAAARSLNCDIACGDFILSYPEKDIVTSVVKQSLFSQINRKKFLDTAPIPSVISGVVVAGFWGGCSSCSKLIKRGLLLSFPFYEGACCDDIATVLPILSATERVAYVSNAYYYYVQTDHSMERNSNALQRLDAISAIGQALIRFEAVSADKDYSYMIIAHSFLSVVTSLLTNNCNQELPDLYRMICDRLSAVYHHDKWLPLLSLEENNYLTYSIDILPEPMREKAKELITFFYNFGRDASLGDTMLLPEKSTRPLVSIIIPVYNGSNFLKIAIDSALNQTYPNIEVLVVNDGSKDFGATDLIARSYGDKVRYFRKENGGVATALNFGIEQSRGEYISWLSHDDVYLPNKVECEMNLLDTLSDKDTIVFSAYKTIDQTGKVIDEYHLPEHVYQNVKCLLSLDITYTLNGCTTLIPKKILTEEYAFNPKLRYTQDYDLWYRLCQRFPFAYSDECLLLSRQHPQQDSKSAGSAVTLEADIYHSKAVNELSWSDVAPYLQNGQTLERLWFSYHDAGFPGTAAAILALGFKYDLFRAGQHGALKFVERNLGVCSRDGDAFSRFIDEREDTRDVLAIYSNIWIRGGVERVLSVLIPHFCKRFKVVLISCPYQNMAGYELPDEVIHIRINNEHSLPQSVRIGAIAQIVGARFFLGNPNIIAGFLPTYKVLRTLGICSIALNHYFYFLPYRENWLFPVVEARDSAFRYADVVLWLTTFSASVCAATHTNVGVMPNPNTFSSPGEVRLRSKKQVIAVGRFFDTMKRVDRIVELFGYVYRRDHQARLTLVGGYALDDIMPSGRSLRQILASEGFPQGVVTLAGEQEDVRPYYENAQVLLLSSSCEGFCMALTEAGTFGVPAVVYGTPGLEDVITDNENGFLVPEGQIDVAADHVVFLLNHHEEWKRMSQNAQKMAQRFSTESIVSRWFKLFDLLYDSDLSSIGNQLKELGLGLPDKIDTQTLCSIAYEFQKNPLVPGQQGLMVTGSGDAQLYIQEVSNMQQSLSWRITKPLRLVKKAMIILKTYGFRVFCNKLINKIRS